MKYKLKDNVGPHSHQEPGEEPFDVKPGDIVDTDAPLDRMFPDKFVPVEGLPPTPAVDPDEEETPIKVKEQPAVKEPAKKATEKKDKKKSTKKPPKAKPFKDVTEKFSHAKEEDFKVFTKDRGYWVAEADDPNTILNEKKLKKGEVDGFIDAYLKG